MVPPLGVTPGPGGEHPLMGTHNWLLRVATVDHPRAYLEIIAVQPGRVPQRARRWFDFDDEQLRDTLARSGPGLVHFVASVPDLRQALAAWQPLDLDRGPPVAASRMTPRAARMADHRARGWAAIVRGHAADADRVGRDAPCLRHARVRRHIAVAGDPPSAGRQLRAACEAIGLQGVAIKEGDANLCAVLDTPRGRARLDSGGV